MTSIKAPRGDALYRLAPRLPLRSAPAAAAPPPAAACRPPLPPSAAADPRSVAAPRPVPEPWHLSSPALPSVQHSGQEVEGTTRNELLPLPRTFRRPAFVAPCPLHNQSRQAAPAAASAAVPPSQLASSHAAPGALLPPPPQRLLAPPGWPALLQPLPPARRCRHLCPWHSDRWWPWTVCAPAGPLTRPLSGHQPARSRAAGCRGGPVAGSSPPAAPAAGRPPAWRAAGGEPGWNQRQLISCVSVCDAVVQQTPGARARRPKSAANKAREPGGVDRCRPARPCPAAHQRLAQQALIVLVARRLPLPLNRLQFGVVRGSHVLPKQVLLFSAVCRHSGGENKEWMR